MRPNKSKVVKSTLISRALLSLKTRISCGTRLHVTSAPATKPRDSAKDKIGPSSLFVPDVLPSPNLLAGLYQLPWSILDGFSQVVSFNYVAIF